jgi:DNA-binding MarR family transcriptional regulator
MKPPDPPGSDPWALLVKLFVAQRANIAPLAAQLRLSPAQCHVLRLIEPDQPLPMGQLAESLACHASNVTGLVDRLESRGLVRRRPAAGDRRIRVLVLTPTGAQLRAALVDRMMAPPALRRLSPGEQRALVRILRRVLDEA